VILLKALFKKKLALGYKKNASGGLNIVNIAAIAPFLTIAIPKKIEEIITQLNYKILR
jgi:hypothetical protein